MDDDFLDDPDGVDGRHGPGANHGADDGDDGANHDGADHDDGVAADDDGAPASAAAAAEDTRC